MATIFTNPELMKLRKIELQAAFAKASEIAYSDRSDDQEKRKAQASMQNIKRTLKSRKGFGF